MIKPQPTPTENELSRLLDAATVADAGMRDRAMLELLAGCGLTTAELARARRDDLHEQTLTVSGRKGVVREITLTHQAQYYLTNYLTTRHDQVPYLFIRHDRARAGAPMAHLTARSIQRALERHRKSAGIRQRLTPSALRRVFARNSLKGGITLENLRLLLGHNHPGSTRRLSALVAGDLQAATI